MEWKESARQRIEALKTDTLALYLAYSSQAVPWYAKAWSALVVAYAFSPVDLIPDFIPILGYVDDLILLPLGVGVAIRLIPAEVMAECRQKAGELLSQPHPERWQGAVIIAVVWLAGLIALGLVVWRVLDK